MGSSTGAFTRSTGSYAVGGSTPALLADSFVTGPGDDLSIGFTGVAYSQESMPVLYPGTRSQ